MALALGNRAIRFEPVPFASYPSKRKCRVTCQANTEDQGSVEQRWIAASLTAASFLCATDLALAVQGGAFDALELSSGSQTGVVLPSKPKKKTLFGPEIVQEAPSKKAEPVPAPKIETKTTPQKPPKRAPTPKPVIKKDQPVKSEAEKTIVPKPSLKKQAPPPKPIVKKEEPKKTVITPKPAPAPRAIVKEEPKKTVITPKSAPAPKPVVKTEPLKATAKSEVLPEKPIETPEPLKSTIVQPIPEKKPIQKPKPLKSTIKKLEPKKVAPSAKPKKPVTTPSLSIPSFSPPKISTPSISLPSVSASSRDATEALALVGFEVILLVIVSSTVSGLLKKKA